MKNAKTIIAVAALSALASRGFSQGQVQLQNSVVSGLYFNSTANNANKVTGAPLPDGGVVEVGLFWSTTVFTDAAQGTLADIVNMSPTLPGSIAGGAVALAGAAAGDNVYVQVYAWDSLYADPDAALAAGALFGAWSAGADNTVYGAVGAPHLVGPLTVSPAPPIPLFGTGPGQFGRCVVLSSPEPTTLAFSGVGAVALWMFRRRKQASAA